MKLISGLILGCFVFFFNGCAVTNFYDSDANQPEVIFSSEFTEQDETSEDKAASTDLSSEEEEIEANGNEAGSEVRYQKKMSRNFWDMLPFIPGFS